MIIVFVWCEIHSKFLDMVSSKFMQEIPHLNMYLKKKNNESVGLNFTQRLSKVLWHMPQGVKWQPTVSNLFMYVLLAFSCQYGWQRAPSSHMTSRALTKCFPILYLSNYFCVYVQSQPGHN